MGILDRLGSILKIDASGLKSFTIKLLSNGKLIEIHDNRRVINIGVGAFKGRKRKQLGEILRQAIQEEDHLLIEEGSKKVLDDFSAVDSTPENKQVLNFFRDKIPPEDIEILRTSLYLKSLHERGRSRELVGKVKEDIGRKYGQKGRNIANLCTAGYFTSIIKPLYEELSARPDFTIEQFRSRYEIIVTQYPFAVFVSRVMTVGDLKKKIKAKIKRNKRYGVRKLNIHAISMENVSKIQEVLPTLEKEFTKKPEIDSGQNFINVRIWF